MQVYTGPKAVLADAELSHWFHVTKGMAVMRNLGIDHQAGRRRRIATLQSRFKKNKQRRLKLRSLRVPTLKTRLRLHRGGIQSVALWGVEGQGLAP